MENTSPVKKPDRFGLFLFVLMLIIYGIILFSLFPNFTSQQNYNHQIPLSVEGNVGLDEILALGRQNMEHENLLSQIREDLKIPSGIEIKIFIGPYYIISGEGRLIYSTRPFAFVLLLDESFYQTLTDKEKIALIAHELGHLTNEVFFIINNPDTDLLFQMEADAYATKYVQPETMINVLRKANATHVEFVSNKYKRYFELRIQNLEKIKQGH